jgi:hypothetical protein
MPLKRGAALAMLLHHGPDCYWQVSGGVVNHCWACLRDVAQISSLPKTFSEIVAATKRGSENPEDVMPFTVNKFIGQHTLSGLTLRVFHPDVFSKHLLNIRRKFDWWQKSWILHMRKVFNIR